MVSLLFSRSILLHTFSKRSFAFVCNVVSSSTIVACMPCCGVNGNINFCLLLGPCSWSFSYCGHRWLLSNAGFLWFFVFSRTYFLLRFGRNGWFGTFLGFALDDFLMPLHNSNKSNGWYSGSSQMRWDEISCWNTCPRSPLWVVFVTWFESAGLTIILINGNTQETVLSSHVLAVIIVQIVFQMYHVLAIFTSDL